MNIPAFPEDADTYVIQLDRALARMPDAQRAEIVQEIRGHLADRAAQGHEALRAAIAELGTPRALAGSFLDDYVVTAPLQQRRGVSLLFAILGRAGRSFAAFGTASVGVFGYVFAAAYLALAVMKPIFPDHVGLWVGADGLPREFGGIWGIMPVGHEVLGLWMTPLCLVLAAAFYLLGGFLMRVAARRFMVRRPAKG